MRKLPVFLLLASGLFSLAAANAQLADHYNLNGNGVDSVGGANGTLTGNASFTTVAGALTTTGGSGDYLSLPGLGSNITGNFSIQIYATAATANQGASYASLFSFATNPSDSNFLLFNPNRPGPNATTADFNQGTLGNHEANISASSALLSDGMEHDLLLTYTQSTGAVSIYNNGVLAGTGNAGAGFNFSLAAGPGIFNGINGHGPFGDGSFVGSTDDFRVFSNAVTATQATALDAAGVNASDAAINAIVVPEPATWMGMAMLVGLSTRVGLRRFRRSVA